VTLQGYLMFLARNQAMHSQKDPNILTLPEIMLLYQNIWMLEMGLDENKTFYLYSR